MSPVLILRNLRLIIFETLENTIEDRGPVEEEERRKRMQVVERFQTAPSEEIAALCGSRVISWYQNLNLNMNLFGRSWSDWNLCEQTDVQF
ncbi:protein EFR3 homolog B-like isoform X1 [Girardinichthys multiradiatus]|uniref:protein EFR3 homolog B-like isoform X1 n=1 Tax=Girardinichthys multiradiatus TaxID=208333 RepID=UPI001FAC7F37|nr:protein EFR3 homolog B-like isoform X1 [Girardinichthys multiradiatus]